jgi:hypothetical protein
MAARFDPATLAALGRVREVEIETTALDGTETHRTIIWIVTSDEEAFIRSVRGSTARWYSEARQHPDAVLHIEGTSFPVALVPAGDPDSIRRVSAALNAKYARVSAASTAAMVAAHTLETTLRVDPRQA